MNRRPSFRFVFDQEDRTVYHDIYFSGPRTGLVPAAPPVQEQMRQDGLDLNTIADDLEAWGREQPDVNSIEVDYSGRWYSISVLLDELSEERVTDIYLAAPRLARLFGDYKPVLHVFGPKQKDSFSYPGSHEIRIR